MILKENNSLETQNRLKEYYLLKIETLNEANALQYTKEDGQAVDEFRNYLDQSSSLGLKTHPVNKEYHTYFMDGIKKLTEKQCKMFDLGMKLKNYDRTIEYIKYEGNEYCTMTKECPNTLEVIMSGGNPSYQAYCGDHKPN